MEFNVRSYSLLEVCVCLYYWILTSRALQRFVLLSAHKMEFNVRSYSLLEVCFCLYYWILTSRAALHVFLRDCWQIREQRESVALLS
jgi:hypothetical protein